MRDEAVAPRIALVGAGGLGGPIAHALAAAGAQLEIFDGDVVEASNLHRQVQFALADVGRPKASTLAGELARYRAAAIGRDERWSAAIAPACDVIVDGSDDPATKFAVADWAGERGVCSVIAGALGVGGNVFLSAPGTACFRCLFEEPPEEAPTCADAGVLGPVVAGIAALAAAAALELAAGRRERAGAIWIVENALLRPAPRRVEVARRADCPSCAVREAA
jgi:molybdopterin/thiamine biosynthesis adenylyltransferase